MSQYSLKFLIKLFLAFLTIGDILITVQGAQRFIKEDVQISENHKNPALSSAGQIRQKRSASFYPGFGGNGIGVGNGFYPGSGIGVYPQNPGNVVVYPQNPGNVVYPQNPGSGIYNPNNVNAYCGGYNEVDCSSICYYQGYQFYQCQANQCYCF